jgi:hypothetical protein
VLTGKLEKYAGREGVILAVPKGGVPIGYIVARKTGLPLDLLLTKKIGHPPMSKIKTPEKPSELPDPGKRPEIRPDLPLEPTAPERGPEISPEVEPQEPSPSEIPVLAISAGEIV